MIRLDEQIKKEIRSVKGLSEGKFKDSPNFKQINKISKEWDKIFDDVFKWNKKNES